MQDKLYKILKIKIDSINRNIDNLNYLNSELDRNNNDLNYIEEKIELFGANNVLAFDSLSRDEFEKVLLMLDPSVAEVFQDKTCNYQGIMYIIQGIRQGISLELTDVQTNAIQTFIEEMINKKASLEDVIANLNESKKRLPETEMQVLNSDLKKYQTIVSKLEEGLYVVEVDDIIEALDFASISLEEKVLIFEYLLRYNANIYASNQAPTPEEVPEEEYGLKEIDVPEFHYEPINIYDEITNQDKEEDKEIEEVKDDKIEIKEDNKEELDKTKIMPSIKEDDFPFGVYEEKEEELPKDEKVNFEEVKFEMPKVEMPKVEEIKFETSKVETPKVEEIKVEAPKVELPKVEEIKFEPPKVDIPKFEEIKFEEPKVDVPKTFESIPETKVEMPNFETPKEELAPIEIPAPSIETPKDENIGNNIQTGTSTAELEDIIEKIDAKLKEMESDNNGSNVTSVNIPDNNSVNLESANQTKVRDILGKEGIDADAINGINLMNDTNVVEVLNILKENNLLDKLKINPNILGQILIVSSSELKLLINAINDNLKVKDKDVYDIIIKTMPTLLTNEKIIDDFLKNINFYKEHNINLINLFDNYRELLIIENTSLENNYNLIKDYKIELNDDNVKYLLANKRVLKNLDYYLEAKGKEKTGLLGHEEEFDGISYITKNPYKLNNISKTALMKLRYQTEKGQKIYGKPGILSGEITNPRVDVLELPLDYKNLYFDNEYTFTNQSELDKFNEELSHKKDFDMTISENILKLDSKYKIDDLRYRINDLIFSRLKTIRLYNYFVTKNIPLKEAMLIALTYDRVIKRDEYLNLEREITTLLEGGN